MLYLACRPPSTSSIALLCGISYIAMELLSWLPVLLCIVCWKLFLSKHSVVTIIFFTPAVHTLLAWAGQNAAVLNSAHVLGVRHRGGHPAVIRVALNKTVKLLINQHIHPASHPSIHPPASHSVTSAGWSVILLIAGSFGWSVTQSLLWH